MSLMQSDIDALLSAAEGAAAEDGEYTGRSIDDKPTEQVIPANSPASRSEDRPPVSENPKLERVLRLEVPIIVRLAERDMPVEDVLDLTMGSIVEFDRSSDSQLDLMVNNKVIGYGQAVKVGENFGLRVTEIHPVGEKIEALGG